MTPATNHEHDPRGASVSDVNRCASCKHWQNPWDDPGSGTSKIPDDDRPRWGVCALIDMPDYSEKTTTIAFTQDGSDYAADLHTRDDFGCVLHEPHTNEEHP